MLGWRGREEKGNAPVHPFSLFSQLDLIQVYLARKSAIRRVVSSFTMRRRGWRRGFERECGRNERFDFVNAAVKGGELRFCRRRWISTW